MGIVKQYHKDTDTTYVYESFSYYDKDKKQSRSKRRVIGKIDKETGEIIPTGRKGPKKKDAPEERGTETSGAETVEGRKKAAADREDLHRKAEEQEKMIKLLRSRIDMLEEENRKLRSEKDDVSALRKENRRLSDIIGRIRMLAAEGE